MCDQRTTHAAIASATTLLHALQHSCTHARTHARTQARTVLDGQALDGRELGVHLAQPQDRVDDAAEPGDDGREEHRVVEGRLARGYLEGGAGRIRARNLSASERVSATAVVCSPLLRVIHKAR